MSAYVKQNGSVERQACKEVGACDTARSSRGPTGLCGTSYASLRDQAIRELSKMQSPPGGDARTELDVEEPVPMEQDSGVESMDEEQPQTELWVEKFREAIQQTFVPLAQLVIIEPVCLRTFKEVLDTNSL